MPTFEDSSADAAEAQLALRGLAHATRSIRDPGELYSVLGSLSGALRSLEQSLHQLAAFHDGAKGPRAVVNDNPAGGSSRWLSGGLGAASSGRDRPPGGRGIDRAHEVEATIAYELGDSPGAARAGSSGCGHGLGL